MISPKIVLIGAGSFVFGPSILAQTFLEHTFNDVELALVDVDSEVVELMAGVGHRMAQTTGARATISAHTDVRDALPGADFVICSVAVQMRARFAQDVACIAEHYPGHLITEFGGVAGISYSLRQMAMIEKLCENIRDLCPTAKLLNVANPLPRVCQRAHELGVETYGFCSASLEAYRLLWKLLEGEDVHYPFNAPREKFALKLAGLNHFCWLLELREKSGGRDLLPEVREGLACGSTIGNPLVESIARETGWLLVPHDGHVHDFLPPSGLTQSLRETSHGTNQERTARLQLMAQIGAGQTSWAPLLEHEAWEKPLDLIAAWCGGTPAQLHSLNVPNNGVIHGLPPQVFVETSARVDADGVHPQSATLPPAPLKYCQHTAQVTDTIVRAARERSKTALQEAVELDPTIVDKSAGWQALQACVTAHNDLLRW
jgi:alpha-galactosidase/6-phospho-beta-glucosidase family protein